MRSKMTLKSNILVMTLSILSIVFFSCKTTVAEHPEAKLQAAGASNKDFLTFAASFDGSRSFRMWYETMELSRRLEKESGKEVNFTYFINGIYYDAFTDEVCDFGRSYSHDESLVRFAVTQQAINEGHEVGNHSYHHGVPRGPGKGCEYYNNDSFSEEFWRDDFRKMHELVEQHLAEPVLDQNGKPLFPKWPVIEGSGGQGMRCQSDSDCQQGFCLGLSPDTRICSKKCNLDERFPCDPAKAPQFCDLNGETRISRCEQGMICGAFNTVNMKYDTHDICVPKPILPVIDADGQELVDANGKLNRTAINNKKVIPYRMKGIRAPFLKWHNSFPVLKEFDYDYDASQVGVRIGHPYFPEGGYRFREFPVARLDKDISEEMFGIGKFRHEYLPLPFNTEYHEGSYAQRDANGDRILGPDGKFVKVKYTLQDMIDHLKGSILWAYRSESASHWDIASHFAPWEDDKVVFYEPFASVIEWATLGCKNDSGVEECPKLRYGNFQELSNYYKDCGGFRMSARQRCKSLDQINTCVNQGRGLVQCNNEQAGYVILKDGERVATPQSLYHNVVCKNMCDSRNPGENDGCEVKTYCD